jgi:hypothetical protein
LRSKIRRTFQTGTLKCSATSLNVSGVSAVMCKRKMFLLAMSAV